MLDSIATRFAQVSPSVDFWSLRLVKEESENISVRQGILQPVHNSTSFGGLITIVDGNRSGYAATSDLSISGLKTAVKHAQRLAQAAQNNSVFSAAKLVQPTHSGSYTTPVETAWKTLPLVEKINLLQEACSALKLSERIVDWQSYLGYQKAEVLFITSDDIRIEQTFHTIAPGLEAVANEGAKTQIRTGGGWGTARQGGLEQLSKLHFPQDAQRIAQQALDLLQAPSCPTDKMDVLLMPSQMMLQIHESIGHPLELDRILGDERNYAGTSFVSMNMFGNYQYGSELLNISFDPSLSEELASYAFDDDGSKAEKIPIIQNGILQRPLGGATSQARAGLEGVANSRASAWNRAPIDRMANLNLEAGNHSLADLIASIEHGILMDTNKSWSIDDSRNKFQFGCEFGQLIENGELKGLVSNPNYRGISATFWRNLAMVGDQTTFDILGTPYCGKGEPNQMIHVGHASPACVFRDVEVFGDN